VPRHLKTLSGNMHEFFFYCETTGTHRVRASHRYQTVKGLNLYTLLVISTEVSGHNVYAGI
jgi:hypothetical protein